MIKLSVQDGTRRQAVAVDGPRARVGRSPECEVQLPSDPTVSRVHALIDVVGDTLTITDPGSRNGVYVNGARVQQSQTLAGGDRIRVGPFVLIVQSDADAYLETVDAAGAEGERLQAATGLSAREVEVLRLVAAGRTDAEIATTLFVSVKTVQSHLDRMRDKTGCRRRPELLRFAIDHGIA
ncbi:MAG: FHA domain-containing protein [Propionibacteriales bacterium]|nr:FHA domain-containing protein [Propionibacteriales bacterium]